MIKVMVVDDHELVRTGITRILNDAPGIRVVGEAASGEEALEVVRQKAPDVLLMDVSMPGIGGLEATRKLVLSDPSLKVIVVSVHADEPYPSRMLQAGATGYLTKGCAVDEIVAAIKAVSTGERYIGADIAQKLALKMTPGGEVSPFDALSPREMQVMLMLTQGQRLQVISDKLCLSPKTVSTYRHRLYEKLSVDSDVELARLAMNYGIIESSMEHAKP
ncbi:MAG: UvrY/SirA/GacA family response regulator transcription factor [Ectothiorhodospiraceae bacterium]|nr:UvrY/SirA/GacA family response regulator transcription factor [Ectothiorhodospiraceae bacterium]